MDSDPALGESISPMRVREQPTGDGDGSEGAEDSIERIGIFDETRGVISEVQSPGQSASLGPPLDDDFPGLTSGAGAVVVLLMGWYRRPARRA